MQPPTDSLSPFLCLLMNGQYPTTISFLEQNIVAQYVSSTPPVLWSLSCVINATTLTNCIESYRSIYRVRQIDAQSCDRATEVGAMRLKRVPGVLHLQRKVERQQEHLLDRCGRHRLEVRFCQLYLDYVVGLRGTPYWIMLGRLGVITNMLAP